MKISENIMIVSGFLYCMFFNFFEKGGAIDTTVAEEQTTTAKTSQDYVNSAYLAIQQGKYDDAYTAFISGVNKNDKTLGGLVFETIIKGLIIFGHLKSFKVNDYSISSRTIDDLKKIPQDSVINVFDAIYTIAHDQEQFSHLKIDACFKKIKNQKRRFGSLRQSS